MSCTTDICGDWEDPQDEPTGQCTPRRLKRSCDAPTAYLNSAAQTVTLTCPEGTVGEEISVTVDAGAINNPFSVSAANAAALAQATAQAAALRAASPCLYPNEEQTCTGECPEGETGVILSATISAADPRFYATTQEEANELALAAACEEVASLREDQPCITDESDAPVAPEFRYKLGSAECVPDVYGNERIPVVYNGAGEAEACIDQYGQYAAATASVGPIAISPTGDGEYGTATYGNLSWSFTRQTYALACGVAYDVLVAATPADASPLWDGDIGGGVGSIVLSQNPVRNPYAFITLIVFDLVGTRVAVPASIQYIDVSKVKFLGCKQGAEEYLETEGEWVDADITTEGYFLPDGSSEEVEFKALQARFTLGTVEEPLVVGAGYRVTARVVSRDNGTSDEYVLDDEFSTFDFIASGTTEVTDWFNLPLPDGKDYKYHSGSVVRVATPTSITIESDGLTWTFVYDMEVFIGEDGIEGLVTEVTGYSDVELSYLSGSGTNTLSFAGSRAVTDDQVATISYTNIGSSIMDGDDVGSYEYEDRAVTNNSGLSSLENYDDLTAEDDGTIASVTGGQPWGDAGKFIVIEHLFNFDTLSGESNGSITEVQYGSLWEDSGKFITIA